LISLSNQSDFIDFSTLEQGKLHSFSTGWLVVFELRALPCGKNIGFGVRMVLLGRGA
jgi:hypothetical protein